MDTVYCFWVSFVDRAPDSPERWITKTQSVFFAAIFTVIQFAWCFSVHGHNYAIMWHDWTPPRPVLLTRTDMICLSHLLPTWTHPLGPLKEARVPICQFHPRASIKHERTWRHRGWGGSPSADDASASYVNRSRCGSTYSIWVAWKLYVVQVREGTDVFLKKGEKHLLASLFNHLFLMTYNDRTVKSALRWFVQSHWPLSKK